MGRDRKGKVSSRHGHGYEHGREQEQHEQINEEEYAPYSYDDGAATPRSYPADLVPAEYEGTMDMNQGQSSPQELGANNTASNFEFYGGQDYAQQQQQQYAAWEAPQGQFWGQQPGYLDAGSSSQPPASSHSGTHRSHSSRDTSSRHSRHGQQRDRHRHREAERTLDELVEQQLSIGTATFDTPHAGEQSYQAPNQDDESMTNAFGNYGGSHPFFSNPMQHGPIDAGAFQNPRFSGYGSARPNGRDFAVYHSREFRVGRVLLIEWAEPQGQNTSTAPYTEFQSVKGKEFFNKNRRFVILLSYSGHSVCAPITTYGNLACVKRGVHPEYHGIIYSTDKQPEMLAGEPALGYPPVAMIPVDLTQSLIKASRVNYSKRYTIEHNFRVSFIGEIRPQDMHVISSVMA